MLPWTKTGEVLVEEKSTAWDKQEELGELFASPLAPRNISLRSGSKYLSVERDPIGTAPLV